MLQMMDIIQVSWWILISTQLRCWSQWLTYGHIEYCGTNVIWDLNPLSIKWIKIPAMNRATKARAPPRTRIAWFYSMNGPIFTAHASRWIWKTPNTNCWPQHHWCQYVAEGSDSQIPEGHLSIWPRSLSGGVCLPVVDQDCSNDTQPLAVCNTLIK